ncbi:hypothetical protein H7696_05435 [Vibrio alginolyticus]|uniref:hypothetical protein n=1 Tax=Vibrio TaxID=662 RepID=UPI0016474941|nr:MULTISPECIES: hypothetical protein [Vibrio]MDW2141815.1 hypothetical protein [Vibrio sp. 1833]QNI27844.1 hypothetical protein H7696_05435 [Vibrio alginolyticus]
METVNLASYIDYIDSFNNKIEDCLGWIRTILSEDLSNFEISCEEDLEFYNELSDFRSNLYNFESSLTSILTYSRSSNINIPVKYLLAYIEELSILKELSKKFPLYDSSVLESLFQISLPLFQLKDKYLSDEAHISAQTLEDLQNRAHEILQKNSAELNKAKHHIRAESRKAIEQLSDNAAAEMEAIQQRIDEVVNRFSKKQEMIDAYFSKLGIAKEGEIYLERAKEEETYANWLRAIGIIFLFTSIALLGFMFKDYLGFGEKLTPETVALLKEISTEVFVLRVMSVLLLTAPALYLLKESAAHRTKENIYRQRGTQIVSLPSYLEGLAEEDKNRLKNDLAISFFSFHDGKADTQSVPDFLRDMKEMVGIAKSINGPQKTVRERLRGK